MISNWCTTFFRHKIKAAEFRIECGTSNFFFSIRWAMSVLGTTEQEVRNPNCRHKRKYLKRHLAHRGLFDHHKKVVTLKAKKKKVPRDGGALFDSHDWSTGIFDRNDPSLIPDGNSGVSPDGPLAMSGDNHLNSHVETSPDHPWSLRDFSSTNFTIFFSIWFRVFFFGDDTLTSTRTKAEIPKNYQNRGWNSTKYRNKGWNFTKLPKSLRFKICGQYWVSRRVISTS